MGATTVWERWDAVLPDGNLNRASHEWKYPAAPDTFRTYDLATPIAVLKADPAGWSALMAILSRQAPEGLDVTGYIESMHRNLRSVLSGIPESDKIEHEIAAVLSGATQIPS